MMTPRKKKDIDGISEVILPPLTKKQRHCLVFIANFYEKFMCYPTHREIADNLKCHPSSVGQMISSLKKKGYLVKITGENRNIRLTKSGKMKLEMINQEEEQWEG